MKSSLFVFFSSESLTTCKYDPRVCERYLEEERELSKDLAKCLKWNDNACIKMDGYIGDLAIAQRCWNPGQSQRII